MWRSAVQLRAGLRYGGIAQLVEHLLCKQRVKSSNLFISTEGQTFNDVWPFLVYRFAVPVFAVVIFCLIFVLNLPTVNFPQIFQAMTKTVLNQCIAEGRAYSAPSCEVVGLSSECSVLTESTGTFTIQDWTEDPDETLTV